MADVRTVIAITGEDERFESVRRAAVERAQAERATLILYDIDAASSPLESPLPTAWSAEGTEDEVGDRLGPEELAAAGRAGVGRQVQAARLAGVDAWGWLPDDAGRDALVDYASRQPGSLLLVPEGEQDLAAGDLPEAVVIPTGRSSRQAT